MLLLLLLLLLFFFFFSGHSNVSLYLKTHPVYNVNRNNCFCLYKCFNSFTGINNQNVNVEENRAKIISCNYYSSHSYAFVFALRRNVLDV